MIFHERFRSRFSKSTASNVKKSNYRDRFGKELSSLPIKRSIGKEFYKFCYSVLILKIHIRRGQGGQGTLGKLSAIVIAKYF